MMTLVHPLLVRIGLTSLSVAACYSFLNVVALTVWRFQKRKLESLIHPPVSVLKPLCGAEPSLYEDLRSFCEQAHPRFQIVFGVRDQSDPAFHIAQRLVGEFPLVPIEVVVNSQLHGSNSKISNLINMLPYAQHDLLVMADSDACVGPDYLKTVTAPLRSQEVGLVTCIYRGVPTPTVWSRLGAMYINEWYVPSILLAWLFGHQSYVSGQTMCVRRQTLRAVGGFEALANHLADDYRLGELVRGLGLRIALSPYVVSGAHHEPSPQSVIRHELRWMRTLHVLRPRSFRCLFLTFSLPLAIIGVVLAGADSPHATSAWMLFVATIVSRLILHFAHRVRGVRSRLADLWLVPVRDLLIGWIWYRSFFSSRVTWRGNEFDVDPKGVMRRLSP
jgi:ceramide glucosyltransferase